MNASENPFSAWTDVWMKAQRQYMDTLGGLSAAGNTSGSTEPLKRSLDSWWQTVQPGAPEPARDLLQRMIGLGKQFFAMSEAVAKQSKSMATLGEAGVDWHKALEQITRDLHPSEDFAGPWVQMLGTWQQAMEHLGDLMPHANNDLDVRANLQRFLASPGVGYTREQQEDAKELARLGLEYLRALQDYKAAFARIGMQAIERLEERLRDMGEEGKKLSTLREVYDLWVECGEEVYGEYVFTDEYRAIHAALVNSMMAYRKHLTGIIDRLHLHLNLPSRGEMDTALKRIQDTRRDNRRLQKELGRLSGIEKELEALRAETAKLARQVAQAGKAAPRPKTSPKTGAKSA